MSAGAGASPMAKAKELSWTASPIRLYAPGLVIAGMVLFGLYLLGVQLSVVLGFWVGVAGLFAGKFREMADIKNIQEAREAKGRWRYAAKIERKIAWRLWPLTWFHRWRAIHSRKVNSSRLEDFDLLMVGRNGISMPDAKAYKFGPVWELIGADLYYDGASLANSKLIKTAQWEADFVRRAIRPLEAKFGKQIPVRVALSVYPHILVRGHGSSNFKLAGKPIGNTMILPWNATRAWVKQGPKVLTRKEIREVADLIEERFPQPKKRRR